MMVTSVCSSKECTHLMLFIPGPNQVNLMKNLEWTWE